MLEMVQEVTKEAEENKEVEKNHSRCFYIYLAQRRASTLLFLVVIYAFYFITQLILNIINTPDLNMPILNYIIQRMSRRYNSSTHL